nr:PREDICTED: carbohydrate sulfotransferase 10-like isoform X1 [Linepithema humile]
MFIKAQFVKCVLCVVLYFIVCVVLITVKKNFNFKETIGITTVNLQTRFSIPNNINKKNVELEINILRMDELNGETIDLQKSAALLQRMSNVCAKYKLKSPLIKKHFLYNAKHNSLYCWIRKVASTSFTKLFSDMSNRQVNNNLYKEIDFLSPKSLRDLLHFTRNNVVFKLLVVRHPFHRLVSSYRDRIEDNSKYTAQAWLYVRQILHLTRPELFHSNSSSSNVLQQMFLTDRKKLFFCRLKIVPSFREFLEWLLKQPPGHDDVHWTPYHTHCAVCDVSYNFILKLDEYTFGDVNYILSKMKLDKSKIYLPRLQRTRTGVTDFNTTCRYFYNLSTDMVLRLYERDKRCKQFWSDRELLKDNKQSGHSSEIND